ncbi:response regulator [Pseudomonas sp. TCU-HL1]|uniref:response regulator n=1 Tax=Pseudomonas sp. TCU-HL1 TaxID=1856685 RepID=UPI00083D1A8A|nr:response regulator [Pseudomonas sp. TCU-HL1]AOE83125.1 transcriptional regulator [Pseudomonas sp. TCU-HL1]
MIKIQLVDDEPHVLAAIQRILRPLHWETHTFEKVEDALTALAEHDYAVIVADLKMPWCNGITYLNFARQKQPDALRVMLSAYGDRETLKQAINQAEIYRFIEKPWQAEEVENTLRGAVERYLLQAEHHRLIEQARVQRSQYDSQQQEYLRLEAESPGLTYVPRDEQGAVLLDELITGSTRGS